jgi:hypothetical protein
MVASKIEIVYVEAHGVVEPTRMILADAGTVHRFVPLRSIL